MQNINSQLTLLSENIGILNEIYNKNERNVNMISHMKDIEEIMMTLNDKIEDLNINYKTIGLSEYAITRVNNNIVAKETIKPFIPLMVYYNTILQQNNSIVE